jgi:nucleoside-diphosphate-sugar epimerase
VKVLVIGGAGYLGRWLVTHLRGEGFDVVPTSRPGGSAMKSAITLDIRNRSEIFATIQRLHPRAVICVAYVMTDALNRDPQIGLEANVLGINSIFEACATSEVPMVIYASSINVYGAQSDFGGGYVTEAMQGRPRTLYGWTKQLNEAQADYYAQRSKTTFVGIRYSGFHGRGRPPGFNPFDQIVGAARSAKDVSLPWSANLEISLLHVDDGARMVGAILSAGDAKHPVYNSGGDAITLGDLGELAHEVAGIKVTFTEPGQQINAVSRVDYSRLHDEFGIELGSPRDWLRREIESEVHVS